MAESSTTAPSTDINAQMAEWTPEQWQQYHQQYYQYYQNYSQNPGGEGAPQQPNQTTTTAPPAQSSTTGGSSDPTADYYSQYYDYYAQYTQQMQEQALAQAQQQFSNPDGQQASRCVWLGNIHPDTTEGELHGTFAQYGMIENIKLLPAKNCAFVRFYEIDSAVGAFNGMSGGQIHGQTIKIGWGKNEPTTEKKDEGPPPCRNLWLGNIGNDITEDQIRMAFARFGQIEKVKLIPAKNCAFVNFVLTESATLAKKEMTGANLGDKPLKINYGRDSTLSEKYANAEPPPFEFPPPEDPARREIIERLAGYVARNGQVFENRVKDGLKLNHKISFLYQDEMDPEYGYYKFKVWCLRYPELDPRQYAREEREQLKERKYATTTTQPNELVTVPQSQSYSSSAQQFVLPTDGYNSMSSGVVKHDQNAPELKKLDEILDNLVPTKDSIKFTKTWMLQHPQFAVDIASATRDRVERSAGFEEKLNLLYLIHDLLYHTCPKRGKEKSEDNAHDEDFFDAFKTHVPAVLKATYTGSLSPEQQEKVTKLLRIWEEKRIFDSGTLKDFEDEMKGKIPLGKSLEKDRDRKHRDDRHHHSSRDDRHHRDDDHKKRRDRDRDHRDDRYESKRRH